MAENGAEIPPSEEAPQVNQEENPAECPVAETDSEFVQDPICDEEEMKKLFVGGITNDTTDDELKEFFETTCGVKITDVAIIRKDTEKKSHFGFLTFETSENVDEVLLKREELKLKDRQLDVNRAVPKNNNTPGAHEKTKKLFIANLPKTDCSEDDLRAYFEKRHPKKYGVIESIQLIKKKDEAGNKLEENKGFGFIMVSTEDFADKMAIQHNTFEFGGRKIELKKSVPNAEGGNKRGRGRGRGGNFGGGHQNYGGQGGYQGGYQGYGGDWSGYQYPGYGAGYGYGGGYDQYGGTGYGGGYGAPQQGRGRGGGGRYRPY